MQPNSRIASLAFSATLALDTRAKELRARGVDVINLALGEPDFPPPAAAVEAAEELMRSNGAKYTPVAGTPGLRDAIAAHLERTRGHAWRREEITVCHSAKHALAATLLVLLEPEDEVLIPSPSWSSYREQVLFAGGRPRATPPRSDCGPDLDALAEAVGPRTRGVMINSPSNPSGYVWTRAEVERLGALALEHDLWILSDEIYDRLVYEGEPAVGPAGLGEEMRARTLLVDGASKAFAMTGFRIGYLAAPAPIAAAVARLNSQLTGCPNAVSQAAYEACLREEPPELSRMVAEFDRRRRALVGGLERLGLATPLPRGAFYAFPSVEDLLDERGTPGFCEDLLEDQALVVVPGTVFDMPAHVRFSYATSLAQLEEGLRRLERFLASRR